MWRNQQHIKALLACLYFLADIAETKQDYKKFTIDDIELCSQFLKHKIKYEAVLINHSRPIYPRRNAAFYCKFQAQSYYSKGGVLAVIQKLKLRKNITTGECIDYIQFFAKNGAPSQKLCGNIEANDVMTSLSYDVQTSSISYDNAYIDLDGELDTVIFLSKEPLKFHEKMEFVIVITSYKDCSQTSGNKNGLRPCNYINYDNLCINNNYFLDGYINCPYYGCVDEIGCLENTVVNKEKSLSVGNKVIFGSITTLAIMFAVFILFIWAFKKHKLFCWAENFAHPSPTSESNRNSRVLEMNEQTGARLAEVQTTNIGPTAPTEEEKDLPPSYDSLFPNSR